MMEVTEMTENTTPHYSTVTTLQSSYSRPPRRPTVVLQSTTYRQSTDTPSPPNQPTEPNSRGDPGEGRIPPRATSGAPEVWF